MRAWRDAPTATTRRTTFSDVATTVIATDRYVGQTGTLTASRIVTLPAAAVVVGGTEIVIADESGSVTGANTLVITRAGADLINGVATLTLTTAYGKARLISDGVSKWTSV